jgi:rod shape determining protein RodA
MPRLSITDPEPRIDWLLLASTTLLMTIGVVFIFSATMVDPAEAAKPLHAQFHVKQIIWAVGGILIGAMICLVDYRTLSRWSLVAFAFANFLLILVLLIGATIWGAKRWINLGLFNLQPSEFAKLAFIFAFAHYLSRPMEELRMRSVFIKCLGMILIPVVLIFVEPDLGSALLFLPVGLVMMFVAGVPARTLKRLVSWSLAIAILMVSYILFVPREMQKWSIKDYQRQRLLVYFDMDFAPKSASEEDKRKARNLKREMSYNVRQALISVGSGGLTGKGFRQGAQNALGFLPRGVAHNDFIFSVIAEETGFVGSVVVVGLYTVFLFCGIRIASQARDRLGRILAAGVVTLFFSQIFINIGMNIRIVPVTGVPLPLLSYGGSSALSSLIAAGILQNVYIYRKTY